MSPRTPWRGAGLFRTHWCPDSGQEVKNAVHPPERVLTFGETAERPATLAVDRAVGVIDVTPARFC